MMTHREMIQDRQLAYFIGKGFLQGYANIGWYSQQDDSFYYLDAGTPWLLKSAKNFGEIVVAKETQQ